MSQEALNLIIGAVIGFASSLLTQIVGYLFQRKNDERKRQWELEDKGIERKLR